MKIKILLLASVVFLLAACSGNEDKTVATVNDVKITQGQLDEALRKQHGVEVLELLMTNEIIKQEAAKQKGMAKRDAYAILKVKKCGGNV